MKYSLKRRLAKLRVGCRTYFAGLKWRHKPIQRGVRIFGESVFTETARIYMKALPSEADLEDWQKVEGTSFVECTIVVVFTDGFKIQLKYVIDPSHFEPYYRYPPKIKIINKQ